MPIQIVPHSLERRDAVIDFNRRMAAGGSPWSFYADPEPDWIPKRAGQNVWREYYLAVEDDAAVRGAYALKPQDWLIHGKVQVVTDWQGPFSEGAIDSRHSTLGLRLIRDMLKKRPLLYSWGHGGDDQPVVQMLRKMNWLLHGTPFCLRVCKPFRFLRGNGQLRTTKARRALLDVLAYSGAGALLLHGLHGVLRLATPSRFHARAVEVPTFGAWADELWHRCKDRYSAIALRDAASMNALVPAQGWPPAIRLRVDDREGRCIGWAVVMDTAMKDDRRFGSLRVGSIVDCLADPADAGEVVAAATRFLKARGVDLLVSNQAHPDWARGFAHNGYVVLQDKRLFAASPALQEALQPFESTAQGLHLTNMDGHGPMAL